jgi:hypothetical protein
MLVFTIQYSGRLHCSTISYTNDGVMMFDCSLSELTQNAIECDQLVPNRPIMVPTFA